MKNSKRLIVTIIVVILLTLTAVSVWAAPGRVGTVPLLPDEVTGMLNESVSFGTGTVTVQASSSSGGTLVVQKVADPVTVVGALPTGWTLLLDEALEITIASGSTTSVQVCVPQSPNMENKNPTFHYWDAVNKVWNAIPTEITSGTPPLICGTGTAEGKYALLGQ